MCKLNKILGFKPNNDQLNALEKITNFLSSDCEDDVYILKGSAGTGKTSIVKAIVHHLYQEGDWVRILAPTGRAANVINEKTGVRTQTIHSAIYYPETLDDGRVSLTRKDNESDKFTVFIVDESSMISNQLHFNSDFHTNRPLLFELIDYVKQGNKKNKIIFVGDRFQLLPVKEEFSPALSLDYLNTHFNLKCKQVELFEVMRQNEKSNVLTLATQVRDSMLNCYDGNLDLNIRNSYGPTGGLDWYLDHFDAANLDKVTMICGSNRDVNWWNSAIRERLGMENYFLSVGDAIVTQATWIDKGGDMQFKGSFGTIISISTDVKGYAGLHFVDAEVCFTSNGHEKIIQTKILLESIYTNSGKLSANQESLLFAEVMKHNPDFRESRNPWDDEYIGALRLRHAYAITCHKAQGGEWDNVLVHPWKIGKDLPWTYTALTRAKKEVLTYSSCSR